MQHTTLAPYLNFDGDCREAMETYRDVLGGELMIQTFAEAGMSKDEATGERIVHAMLKSEHLTLLACDTMPDMKLIKGNNVHLSLAGSDEQSLTDIFQKLSHGGAVDMPLGKQFWGDTFGMLTDKHGIHWMVNISAAA
ncbi:MAG TPA: VOC family protein [Candidatus Peribacteraceae bacterium]|nr:VOC family protein [Candidatus Peribacteraceae bacterium]